MPAVQAELKNHCLAPASTRSATADVPAADSAASAATVAEAAAVFLLLLIPLLLLVGAAAFANLAPTAAVDAVVVVALHLGLAVVPSLGCCARPAAVHRGTMPPRHPQQPH
jgi:hypothetical protein